MEFERKKKVTVVNPDEKKTRKKSSSKKKSGDKKKRAKNPPGEKKKGGKRRKGKGRKKNPGVDFKGHGLNFLGGMLGGVVAQPVGHFAGKMVKNPSGSKALAMFAAAAAPTALGIVVSLAEPNIGKGMTGAGGAALSTRGLDLAADHVGVLADVGYRMSPLPKDYSYENGQLFKAGADGKKSPVFTVTATKTVELTKADGTTLKGDLLGAEGDNAVVLMPDGTLQFLSGVEIAENLGGVEESPRLDGVEESPQLGDGSERATMPLADAYDYTGTLP